MEYKDYRDPETGLTSSQLRSALDRADAERFKDQRELALQREQEDARKAHRRVVEDYQRLKKDSIYASGPVSFISRVAYIYDDKQGPLYLEEAYNGDWLDVLGAGQQVRVTLELLEPGE